MSMFNDINVDKRGNDTSCTLTSVKIQEYATRFMEGRWEKSGFVGMTTNQKEDGTLLLLKWCEISRIRDIPNLRDKPLESWDYAEK